ncbi:hypothetical protein PR003_g23729 [Phytophthora rubi]|uniref:ComEC/Rec2-related protein domain-containing protein n=1 Tax=Phytophthora rubi TaxID=129364 RepID=A0A6A4CUB3_9STRA|nr:hypothetical protein PR003_g23729 [Phytophthora rubi]
MSALLLLTFASFCLKACHAYLPSKIACLLLASITTPVQLYFPSTTALVLHSPWVADLHLAWLQVLDLPSALMLVLLSPLVLPLPSPLMPVAGASLAVGAL